MLQIWVAYSQLFMLREKCRVGTASSINGSCSGGKEKMRVSSDRQTLFGTDRLFFRLNDSASPLTLYPH